VPEREWIDVGLLDPAAPDADERGALLAWLEAQGVTLDEMVAANERAQLHSLTGERRLRPPATMTVEDLAARCGMSPEQVGRVWLAAGFPPPAAGVPVFNDDDLMIFLGAAVAASLFGEDTLLAFIRVMGGSMARIAEAADAMFLADVEGPRREKGAVAVELAMAVDEATAMLAALPDILAPMFRRHAMAAIERSRLARAGMSAGGFTGPYRVSVSVGFADLVGYTALAERTDARELAGVVGRFERAAAERAVAVGARVVKSIGDAVMVVGLDPVGVVDVMAGLVEDVGAEPSLTGVRAAVVAGEVLARDGDYVGPTVNLAARATKEAPVDGVVVNEPVAAALAAVGRPTTSLPPRSLRGLDEPVVLSLVERR
jgi:class 3 adenylate cyclase